MRKRRTRQHEIEDLSYCYVEWQVLKAKAVFQRYPIRQYSYDATIHTFSEEGDYENGKVFVQIKATDKLVYSRKNKGYQVRLDVRDLDLWLDEVFPVIVVIFDAEKERGFFIDLRRYFEENKIILQNIHKSKLVFVPKQNLLTPTVIQNYQTIKNKIYERIKGIQRHGTDL
jgi:Domain of unknown function (DUF4365)